jgi:hypothetical protein
LFRFRASADRFLFSAFRFSSSLLSARTVMLTAFIVI